MLNLNHLLDELTNEEQAELAAELIRRFVGTHPVSALPKVLFHSWVANLPNSPVELMILRTIGEYEYEVLLVHRDDQEFPDCWHTPGSVVLPGETIEHKINALLAREVPNVQVSRPQFVTLYQHRAPGTSRQHEDCFLFACLLQQPWTEEMANNSHGQFFPLNNVPVNTLPSHKDYISLLRAWLKHENCVKIEGPWANITHAPIVSGVLRQW